MAARHRVVAFFIVALAIGACGKVRTPETPESEAGNGGRGGSAGTHAAYGGAGGAGLTNTAGAGAGSGGAGECRDPGCPSDLAWNSIACDCRPRCDLDSLLWKRNVNRTPARCGVLSAESTLAQLEEAQRCVLDALAARQQFDLVVWQQEEQSAIGYASSDRSESVSVLTYSAYGANYPNPELRGSATVGEQVCRTLEVKADCSISVEDLCLECAGLVESSLACSTPLRGEPGNCLGPGTYGRGKGSNPGGCCPELREVYQQVGYQTDDADPMCTWPTGFSAFACVEGFCGDGRCEEAESAPCACPMDCRGGDPSEADAGI